jgi:hypothetical protein
MPAKVRTLIDVHEQNARFTHYDWRVVRPQLDSAITITETFLSQKAAIDADPHLTPKGKDAARVKAAKEALEALGKWHSPRLAGLDADLGTQRAALIPTGDKPDPRRVELMASRLIQFTQEENGVFYNAATGEERQVMEAASSVLGRIPVKAGDGGLELRPVLDPERVNESVMARAAERNPQAVARLNELAEIRAMHVTIASHAVAEIREVLGGVSLDA